jgi:hypothetical protein
MSSSVFGDDIIIIVLSDTILYSHRDPRAGDAARSGWLQCWRCPRVFFVTVSVVVRRGVVGRRVRQFYW